MIISQLPPWLRELKGAPVSVLLALRWVHQPVEQLWLQDATGYKRDTVRDAMRVLRGLGFATYDGDGYCTNCQLTGAAQQLPLGYDLLDESAASTSDQVDPAPLQAGVPLDQAALGSTAIKSQSDALIVLIESESTLSVNNNKSAQSAKKSQLSRRHRELAEHNAKLRAALIERGLEPRSGDAPLPAGLQACADQIVSIGCSGFRAEEAVAYCKANWTAAETMAQIKAWTAHCQSPITGKGLDSRWPYIVATNIQTGKPCGAAPVDPTDPNRFDGYLQYTTDDTPQEGATE